MPLVKEAMITDVISLKPEQSIREAMIVFKENNIRAVPVVDADNKFIGIFGLRHVLKGLLPVAAKMKDGLENLDFLHGSGPGIAKRLKKIYDEPIVDHLDDDTKIVASDSSLWEATRVTAVHGSPTPIVDKETNEFVGVVTRQTLLNHLYSLMDDTNEE